MEQVVLDATQREQTGKGPARRLRQAGFIPGVVYGLGREALALSVVREDLQSLLSKHGTNIVFRLQQAAGRRVGGR